MTYSMTPRSSPAAGAPRFARLPRAAEVHGTPGLLAEGLAVDELRVALSGRHLVDHLPQVVVDRIAGEQAAVELALNLVGELPSSR